MRRLKDRSNGSLKRMKTMKCFQSDFYLVAADTEDRQALLKDLGEKIARERFDRTHTTNKTDDITFSDSEDAE